MSIITTGDDAAIPVQLKKKVSGKKVSFNIDAGATIKAVLVSLDRETILSGVVTLNNAATGTDLSTSLVVVEFTEVETTAITATGEALLEVQVNDGGKLTWTADITVVKGNIA